MRRALSFSLTLVLILTSVGLAPYQAAAEPNVGKAFTPVVETMLPALQAAGGPQTAALEEGLGQLRFDLALKRDEAASFLAQALPGPYRGRPEALDRLEPQARAAALAAAFENARAELDVDAASLLDAAGQRPLTEFESQRLRRLAAAFYLLSPDLASRVRERAESLRKPATMSLLQRLANRLQRRPVSDAQFAAREELRRGFYEGRAAVDAELADLISGAGVVASALPQGSPRGEFARASLAPYAQRALQQAADRLASRGVDAHDLHEAVLTRHQPLFAQKAPMRLVAALRRSGDWTPFVATLSAAAAAAIDPSRGETVAPLSAHPAFRMPIPSWSPFAGPETVADLIAAKFGPAPQTKTEKLEIEFFRLFGIPVGGSVRGLLITAALAFLFFSGGGLANTLITAAMIYGSVIAHEFGHALTARRYGIGTTSITINPLGGMASLSREPQGAAEEFWVTLNGPLVNFAIAAAAWVALHAVASPVLHAAMTFNLFMGAFNLFLPAFPMDGARVLRSLLTVVLRDDYAAGYVTYAVARVLAPLIMFGGVFVLGNPVLVFIGLFVMQAAPFALRPGTETLPAKE